MRLLLLLSFVRNEEKGMTGFGFMLFSDVTIPGGNPRVEGSVSLVNRTLLTLVWAWASISRP